MNQNKGSLLLLSFLCLPKLLTYGELFMLNALIFDFDGIIVDTEPLHFAAFNEVLKPLKKSFTWEEYCETYIGFDDRDAFRTAFAKEGVCTKDLNHLIKEKAVAFQKRVHEGKAKPLPGAIELIKSLPSTLPVALCSGALREDVDPILRQLGIEAYFDVIVTANDTSRSKPDPAPYRLVLERLGINNPQTTIAIEDTPAGILSAKENNLKVLAVTNSYDRDYLIEADAVIDSLEKITALSLEDIVN